MISFWMVMDLYCFSGGVYDPLQTFGWAGAEKEEGQELTPPPPKTAILKSVFFWLPHNATLQGVSKCLADPSFKSCVHSLLPNLAPFPGYYTLQCHLKGWKKRTWEKGLGPIVSCALAPPKACHPASSLWTVTIFFCCVILNHTCTEYNLFKIRK